MGPYELLKPLALGGMAEVFLARRRVSGGVEKRLVIKRIRRERASDPRFVSMFVEEARLSMALVHKNIVPVFDFGRVGDELFLAMEVIDGCDLGVVLEASRAQARPLNPMLVAYIALEACQGLDYAHHATAADGTPRALVHRDVTPRNVLLSRAGEIKLVDFGVATSTTEVEIGKVRGTPAYMSPEQAHGRPVDARTDLFSLGLVMWEALSGRRAYDAKDRDGRLAQARAAQVPALPRGVPAGLAEIVTRSTATDPDDRFDSARSMQLALDEYVVAARAASGGAPPSHLLAAWLSSHVTSQPAAQETSLPASNAPVVSFLDDGVGSILAPATGSASDGDRAAAARALVPELAPSYATIRSLAETMAEDDGDGDGDGEDKDQATAESNSQDDSESGNPLAARDAEDDESPNDSLDSTADDVIASSLSAARQSGRIIADEYSDSDRLRARRASTAIPELDEPSLEDSSEQTPGPTETRTPRSNRQPRADKRLLPDRDAHRRAPRGSLSTVLGVAAIVALTMTLTLMLRPAPRLADAVDEPRATPVAGQRPTATPPGAATPQLAQPTPGAAAQPPTAAPPASANTSTDTGTDTGTDTSTDTSGADDDATAAKPPRPAGDQARSLPAAGRALAEPSPTRPRASSDRPAQAPQRRPARPDGNDTAPPARTDDDPSATATAPPSSPGEPQPADDAADAHTRQGTIQVGFKTWGNVSVRDRSESCLKAMRCTLRLPAGRYTLDLEHPISGERSRREVTLAAGQTVTIIESFEQ